MPDQLDKSSRSLPETEHGINPIQFAIVYFVQLSIPALTIELKAQVSLRFRGTLSFTS